MIEKIRSSCTKHKLLLPGQHVLVAVSGGADSTALLLALRDLARILQVRITAAHLNHSIRGKQSDADAAFVRKLAAQLQVPCVQEKISVPSLARRKGLSLEMAAREARYEFLTHTARKIRADVIATAHTADDQAETILLKLGRGAGPRGLTGIPRETVLHGVRVVRPTLEIAHEEIVEFLRRRKQAWREDRTNADVSYLRNRVRHEVLPLLEAKLNPGIRQALARTAEVLREEDRFLDNLAYHALAKCSELDGDLNICFLMQEPLAVRRRVLRLWLVTYGVIPELLDFDTVDRVENLIENSGGTGEIEIIGNYRVIKRYEQISLLPEKARGSKPWKIQVKIPGETLVNDANLRIVTSLEPGLKKQKKLRMGMFPAWASIRYSALGKRKLFVRSWRHGDRMKPLGMNGSKKLQDIFVDEKVPADERPGVPVFECAGEIVWLPGYRVAHGWEVKDPKAPALQVRVERPAPPVAP
jgi:tRNA(Ile)-lysidine synthase